MLFLAAGAFFWKADQYGWRQRIDPQKNKFNAEQQQRLLAANRRYMGTGTGFTYDTGAFDTYMEERQASVALFAETKVAGAAIGEKLADSPEITQAIADALSPNPSLAKAQKNYEGAAKNFAKLCKGIPKEYRTEQVIQAMKDLVDDGVKAIRAQQKAEKAALTDKLKNSTLLEKALGPTDPQQIDAARKAMLKDLETAHKSQLDAFNKSTSESLNKLHQATSTEIARVNFLATIRADNEEQFLKLYAQHGGRTLVASMGTDPDNPDMGVINISDLETFKTRNNTTITQSKTDDGKSKFTMTMGMQINPFNFGYYLFGEHVEEDMTTMAQAVRASGHSSITANINFDNPELAKQRAQQAYKSCIEAGFPPEKIKIKINGVVQKNEELFTAQELQAINGRAAEVKKGMAQLKVRPGGDTRAVKARMQELKTIDRYETAAMEARAARKENPSQDTFEPEPIKVDRAVARAQGAKDGKTGAQVDQDVEAFEQQQAKIAFEAGIAAGFPPDKIKVTTSTGDFVPDPTELAAYEAQAQARDTELEAKEAQGATEEEEESEENEESAAPTA